MGPVAAETQWESFYGRCSPTTHYTQTHLTNEAACHKLCSKLASCVAYSFDSDMSCTVTTACFQRDTSRVETTTFLKPGVSTPSPSDDNAERKAHSKVAIDVAAPKVDKCHYCPPQQECEQARLCRSGRCFHGLPLPNGSPCGDGDSCQGGKCVVANNIQRITRQDSQRQKRFYRIGSHEFARLQEGEMT